MSLDFQFSTRLSRLQMQTGQASSLMKSKFCVRLKILLIESPDPEVLVVGSASTAFDTSCQEA